MTSKLCGDIHWTEIGVQKICTLNDGHIGEHFYEEYNCQEMQQEQLCQCGFLTDGKFFVCPIHYSKILENSSIKYGLITDKETARSFGINIVREDKLV